ncbi:hypothetical protein, partial [Acetobacter nitrogenifigens]|uniref:hypothetical protein n=1 Tax=Acetobacter nitrogenifigens TaxID=285268 RepID=UPI00047B57D8
MPSISDMRVAYESDVAAKAKADADALNSAGNAAETLDKKITSTTKSGAAFVNRFDDVTRTAKAVERAQRDLDAAQDALNKSMANGSVTAEQAQRTLQTLGDRVTQATAKHQAATAAQKTLAEATDSVTTAAERNTASVKLQSYQIAQIADEFHKWVDQVLAGGSAITATTYQLPNMVQAMGGVGNAAKVVGGFLAGPGGIAVAAAAAGVSLYAMASRAETDQEKFAALSTQLRATRTDAMSMASAITSASDSLKGMPGWDEASARTASQAIGGTYDFSGNSSDITALAGVARDAGAVFGSLEDGLKAVQTAMTDPLAEIRDLYQRHLPGVNAQLVDQVRDLEAAGKQGAAYALVMEHLTDAVKNAHEESLTPFQRAMEDLNKAASPLLDTLEKLATGIGTKLLNGVTSLLNLLPHSDAASQSASGTHVVTNPSSGTLGIMQINPAYSSQYDVNSLSGNIDEGITRYQNFLKQSGGNLENALALYGGWKTGSAGGQQYASSVFGQNLADLTPAISKAIDQEAQKFGLGDGLTSLIKKIALQESGGRQWDDQSYATPSAASSAAATAHATSAAVISDQAALSAGAADAANGYSSTSITQSRQAIEDWIGVHEKMLGGLTQGSREWQEESERITNAKIALANTLDPQTSITQGMKDQNESLSAQSGWWRSMAEVVAQFDTTTRGTGVNQQALTQALTEKQRQLTAAYEDGTTEIERQVRAQAAISSAAGDSSRALQHAANYQEAYNAATQNFDPASQKFVEEVNARVSALDALSDAQQRTQQLQQNRGLSDNLALLQAETASIGQDSDARQVGIARLQAEMEMRRQYGAVLPQEAQDYVELSRQVSAASVAYERQQQTLSDLTGSISNMADQLSDGLVQGFLQGTSSGMSFKSTLQAIETQIASMILKMGLINPLLNDIDGGTRDTLSDISKLLGNLGGSSGSSSGDGWGSTGGAMDFEGSGISVGQELNLKNSLSSPASATSATSGSWLQSALGTKVIGNASIGNMLAGLGGGMAVGGLVGSLTGGGSGSTIGSLVGSAGGTGIGALIGTGLSSIGGPLGAVIGGTVLGGIGSLIGSLFSKSHYAYDSVSGQDGQLVISDRRVKRSDDDVSGSLQSALDAINAVYGYTGVSVDDGFVGDVGHYKKGKNSNSQTLEQHLGDAHLTSSDATMQMALDQLMPSSFDSVSSYTQAIQSLKTLSDTLDNMGVVVGRFDDSSHLTVAHFTGYTGDMATALSTL